MTTYGGKRTIENVSYCDWRLEYWSELSLNCGFASQSGHTNDFEIRSFPPDAHQKRKERKVRGTYTCCTSRCTLAATRSCIFACFCLRQTLICITYVYFYIIVQPSAGLAALARICILSPFIHLL